MFTFTLPFKNIWFIFWGGDTKKLNHHHNNPAQKYAFDFIMVNKQNLSYKNSGKKNEDYYCFGKEILSPAKGEIVQVIDGVDDNKPGFLNGYWIPGNTVIIKHSSKIFSFLAHLKQNSIQVKVGDKVNTEDLLGLCGNSGNSSEPHLHFHIQNKPNILFAKGIKCYFKNKDSKVYSPVKGDFVSQEVFSATS